MAVTYEELRTKIINAIESYLTTPKGTYFFGQTTLFNKTDATNFITYYLEKIGTLPTVHRLAKIDENRFAQITFLLTLIRCFDVVLKTTSESENYTPEQITLLLATATDFIFTEAHQTSTTQSAFYNALKTVTNLTSQMYPFSHSYEITAQLRHFIWKQIFVDPNTVMKGCMPGNIFSETPMEEICSKLLMRENTLYIHQVCHSLNVTPSTHKVSDHKDEPPIKETPNEDGPVLATPSSF